MPASPSLGHLSSRMRFEGWAERGPVAGLWSSPYGFSWVRDWVTHWCREVGVVGSSGAAGLLHFGLFTGAAPEIIFTKEGWARPVAVERKDRSRVGRELLCWDVPLAGRHHADRSGRWWRATQTICGFLQHRAAGV